MEVNLEGILQGNPRNWKLGDGHHRIGRGTHSEVLLTDPSVSRSHAELTIEGDRVEVTDLGSRNGTWVNDQPARPTATLRMGDRLRLGNVDLILRDEKAAPSESLSSNAILADAEQVHGTVHLQWDQVKSDLDSRSRLDRSLFQVMTEAGHLLVLQQPLEEIFETVLDLVESWIPTRRVFLLLIDEKQDQPVVRAARPTQPHSGEKLMLSRTLMDTVLKDQESLLVTDAKTDPRFGEQASIVAMDIRSALVAPLFDNKNIIGLIYADTSDPSVRYDLDQLKVFTMLANLIAVKITNTHLLEDQRAKERMEQEMATAARIQRALLPADLPVEHGYEILAHQFPCFETAGDLYDAECQDDGRICLTVGDVSGKGIGSALLMSHVIATIRVLYGLDLDARTLIERLHRQILASSEAANYATLFFGRLDPERHRLEFVNAGHNPPYLVSPAGEVDTLDSTGPPIGLLEDSTFEIDNRQFEAGALLCIFSDGITEAADEAGEFYGEERLIESIRENVRRPLEEIASEIFEDLKGFQGSAPQNDDITLFLVRRKAGG